MNERVCRRWRSCGLYVNNPGQKNCLCHSDDHLTLCGRNFSTYVTKLSKSTWQIYNKKKSKSDDEFSFAQFRSEPKFDYNDAVEWVDRRSELPPSLGWYSPRKGRTKGYYQNSFEQSMEAKSLERSFEEILDKSFQDVPSPWDASEIDGQQANTSSNKDETKHLGNQTSNMTKDNGHLWKGSQSGMDISHHDISTTYNGLNYDNNGNNVLCHDIVNRNVTFENDNKPSCSEASSIMVKKEKLNELPKRSKKIHFQDNKKRPHTDEGNQNTGIRKRWKKMANATLTPSSQLQNRVWTSRDLRQYLVMKARQTLGCDSGLPTPSLVTRKTEVTLSGTGILNCANSENKILISCVKQKNMELDQGSVVLSSSKVSKRKESVGLSASKWKPKERILAWGGTYFPRDQALGGSLRLKSHPAPRHHRLWSLPAIILTPSEDVPTFSSPSPTTSPSRISNASTVSMQYLQVPQPVSTIPSSHDSGDLSRRRSSTPGMKRKKSKMKSFDDLVPQRDYAGRKSLPSDLEITRSDTHLVSSGVDSCRSKKPSHLNSILSLYCDSNDEEDSDEFKGESGSPPPDHRPADDELYDYEYEESFMYGRYSANLAEFARQEARRLRTEERLDEDELFSKELHPYSGRVARITLKFVRPLWEFTFARLGEDWVFLFVLGLTMASLSFLIDIVVLSCFEARMYLHNELLANIHWALQLFAWILIPTLLIIFAAAFCQWIAPSAAGSGIPEMKTILRGVILKEYLTWKTLVAKIVGLATVLGSGLPVGKEGPVMHMASIVSTMLMNVLSVLKGVVDNEAHQTDLLAAACTMGVAVSYAAPIGGVLFSIEVTAVYFAVRNYWRGFFAAVLGAIFYRLMYVWFLNEKTITPLFKVELNYIVPYDVVELLPFLCIGLICGFAGAAFVYLHRRYVVFIRQNQIIKKIMNKRRLLYPTIVSICISLTTFPLLLGQFMASTVSTKEQILELFSNVTWTVLPNAEILPEQQRILDHWAGPNLNFHISLLIFIFVTIVEIGIASTLPAPTGLLIPLFIVGAALGRQIGELMYYLYPFGIQQTNLYPIVPGAYAMVGAASFVASITHTISISVITFELTGQITYVIPIMIGVLISNCVASLLQPSIYDSVIQIKKLPYLPDIVSTSSDVYNIYVEDIMVRDVKYIWQGITFMDLKRIVKDNRQLKHFPLVDKHDTMILLGSIPRIELVRLLVEQISSEKRRGEAKRTHLDALKKKWEEEDFQGMTKTKRRTSVHYVDEVNYSSDEETTVQKNGIFGSLSKSLSRSLLSLARFRNDNNTADSSSDESDSNAEDLDKEDNSSHQSPPKSPKISSLSELFSAKSSDVKPEPQFTINTVDTQKDSTIKFTIGQDDDYDDDDDNDDFDREVHSRSEMGASEANKEPRALELDSSKLDARSFKSGKDSPKSGKSTPQRRKSHIEFLKDAKNIMKSKMGGREYPLRPEIRLTKSSSLDSLRAAHLSKNDTGTNSSIITSSDSNGTKPRTRRYSVSVDTFRSVQSTSCLSVPPESNYSTITVVDAKLRHAIDKVRKMKSDTASNMELKLSTLSLFKSKKKGCKEREFDMSPEEREVWELRELSKEVDFTICHIDPSPFQLVERTTLLRVHSLFSMLGINHAFVTAIGKLIGVVAIKELRQAIEGQYVGQTSTTNSPTAEKESPSSTSAPPTFAINKEHLSGTSPQRLSTLPSFESHLDAEAGPDIKRSVSKSQFSSYSNGFANR